MQKTWKHVVLGLGLLVGLSACQKSACDYTPDSNRILAADQMLSCLNTLPATVPTAMPTSGSATYSGSMAASVALAGGVTDSLFGDASVTANFTGIGGSVAGNITNVISTTHGNLGSNLAIASGTIISNTVIGANINGTLTGFGAETITLNGTLAGGFLGENAQAVTLATGVVTPAAAVTLSGGGTGTADVAVFGMR